MAYCSSTSLFLALLLVASGIKVSKSINITVINGCNETIWPGIAPNNNIAPSNNSNSGGFTLKPGQSAVFTAPAGWGGRIWGRTGCNFDRNGTGPCQTGDCGGSVKCSSPGQPPASIAQFALGEIDYYDVSLVDGFNLPIVVKPVSGKGNCSIAGCDSDLRQNCPPELAQNSSDGKILACKSACNVFDTDEYCCKGAFNTPMTCMPTNYSRLFKTACPAAYSYAYDDLSIMTCSATDYIVTFCSSRNQTQCSYHDEKLTCDVSKALRLPFQAWQILLLLMLPTVIHKQFWFTEFFIG